MLLNETKGSLGMFSRAGRNSADKYNILVRKDEILGGKKKKFQTKNMFTPDENIQSSDENDDDIDIFKQLSNDKLEGQNKNSTDTEKKPRKQKTSIDELRETRLKKNKKQENPACTKYNPKMEFIWRRTLTGPKWDESKKKTHSKIKKQEMDPPFYKYHEDFKIDGKNFVDFGRQTQRASFSGHKDVRLLNVKSPMDTRTSFKTSTASPKGRTTNTFYNNESKNSALNINTGSSDDEYPQTKNISNIQPKKINKWKMNNTHLGNTNKWVKIQAPDFKKIISRDQLEKIYGDKRTVIPFSFPNFKWTTPSKNLVK
jgi:hypothetical protein